MIACLLYSVNALVYGWGSSTSEGLALGTAGSRSHSQPQHLIWAEVSMLLFPCHYAKIYAANYALFFVSLCRQLCSQSCENGEMRANAKIPRGFRHIIPASCRYFLFKASRLARRLGQMIRCQTSPLRSDIQIYILNTYVYITIC